MKIKWKKYIVLAGIMALSVSCLGGCTGKTDTKENTSIEEQATEENTFQGLADNMVFDVFWKDKEGSWFAGNASCVVVDGMEEPVLLTAYHLFSDEENFGEADSGYRANVMKQKISGTLYDIKDWDGESFMSGEAEFEEGYAKATPVAKIDKPLLVEDAISLHNDVAAFTLKDSSSVTPLKVSESDCQFGDKVYIMGTSFEEHNQRTDCTYEATVVSWDDDLVMLKVTDAIDFYGCSGCPVVNEKGEFVGMLLTSYENYVGMNTTQTIREDLRKLGKSK